MLLFLSVVAVGDLVFGSPVSASNEMGWNSASEAAYRALIDSKLQYEKVERHEGSGVLYAAAGTSEFVRREVVPALRYLEKELRLSGERFVLFLEKELDLAVEDLREITSFFGEEGIYRISARKEIESVRLRAKYIKIKAMQLSPFEVTLYLDFDARPCRADFLERALESVSKEDDLGLTPKYMHQTESRRHYELEHNSALLIYKKSQGTTLLFRAWLLAFQFLIPHHEVRDQPALMVALKYATEYFQFRHKDLPGTFFCRNKISSVVSCDAECVLVHKPQKHDLSLKFFILGPHAEIVADMLQSLKLGPRSYIDQYESPRALFQSAAKARLGLGPAVDKNVHHLSRRFPRAKFIITSCEADLFSQYYSKNRFLRLDLGAKQDASLWSQLCAFVEAWGKCPHHTKIPKPSCEKKKQKNNQASSDPPKVFPRRQLKPGEIAQKARQIKASSPSKACSPQYPRGILYNRMPKSGSASLMSWMARELNVTAKSNGLRKTNVTWWTPHVAKHRWLNSQEDLNEFMASLKQYGAQSPFVTQRHVYHTPQLEDVALINLVRDPISRCISRYNYEAFYKRRIPPIDFDVCLDDPKYCNFDHWQEQRDYANFPVPKSYATPAERKIFLQLSRNDSMALLRDECHDYMTRWFCGHTPECRDPKRPRLALALAMRNVRDHYIHVGLLHDLANTAQILRRRLPAFFAGNSKHIPDQTDFPQLHSKKAPPTTLDANEKLLFKKTKSSPLSARNLDRLTAANKRDLELYDYIVHLHKLRLDLCLEPPLMSQEADSSTQKKWPPRLPADLEDEIRKWKIY